MSRMLKCHVVTDKQLQSQRVFRFLVGGASPDEVGMVCEEGEDTGREEVEEERVLACVNLILYWLRYAFFKMDALLPPGRIKVPMGPTDVEEEEEVFIVPGLLMVDMVWSVYKWERGKGMTRGGREGRREGRKGYVCTDTYEE